MMLECVLNVSEGRDAALLDDLARAAHGHLLDVHVDPHHHRAVLTLAGPPDDLERTVRAVAAHALTAIDLRAHDGVHPRIGALDVVPFVPLERGPDGTVRDGDLTGAAAARDRFAQWCAAQLGVPCFLYGPLADGTVRTLPEVRRRASAGLAPDVGPPDLHPRAGAVAVGARGVLVAYNLFVAGGGLDLARRVAAEIRSPAVRALGLDVGGRPQVSCNLVDPWHTGPEAVYDDVRARLDEHGAAIERAELVGLVPAHVLAAVTQARLDELDLSTDRTIEARLEASAPESRR